MRKLLPILLAVCFAYQAYAQEKRVALVIGNAQYHDVNARLSNPVNDALLMSKTFKELGFTVRTESNKTKAEIMRIVDEVARSLKGTDIFFFYYSGHGYQIDGKNYLVPVDATNVNDNIDAENKAVALDYVFGKVASYATGSNVFILDACRNNPFKSWARSEGDKGFSVVKQTPSGSLIAFSTGPGNVAADGSGTNSPYTIALAKFLKEPGKNIYDVLTNVRNEVHAKSNKTQEPWFNASLPSAFVLKAGNTDNVTFNPGTVETAEGTINIDSEIAGTLYLNGKSLGNLQAGTKGAKLEKVAVGIHTIKIAGTETFETTVTVGKNQTAYINAKNKAPKDLPDQIIDPRDNRTYKIVKIGAQVWFAENLAYTGNNGKQRQITDNKQWAANSTYNGWCYYDNNAANAQKYGVLYQWEAAKNACPKGWHLPSDNEWSTLEDILGGSSIAGKVLKNARDWNENGNGTNDSGFNALPTGYRDDDGEYFSVGSYGYWWCISIDGTTHSWNRSMDYYQNLVNRNLENRSFGFSVRCVKD